MPLESIDELESKEILISSDGDRISDLVREGNDLIDCSLLSITLCVYSNLIDLKILTPIVLCMGDVFVVIAPLATMKMYNII